MGKTYVWAFLYTSLYGKKKVKPLLKLSLTYLRAECVCHQKMKI